jgi:hypothetical protein
VTERVSIPVFTTSLLVSLWLLFSVTAAEARLTFKRPDGAAIRLEAKPRVWCGPWDDQVARPSIHISARGPRRGWELTAVRRHIALGERIEFPNEFVSTRPHGAQLFVFTPRIEASSAEEEGSGSLTFLRAGCQLDDAVELSVDAVLGSELFGGTRVEVSGTYRGHVSVPPDAHQ